MATEDGTDNLPAAPDARRLAHPCTFPPPQSVIQPAIKCTTRTFLTDILPAAYPYMPYYGGTSSSPTSKFQVPFFSFTGSGPPPPDIGALGDVYLDADANVLYAYLVPAEDEVGAWIRWTAPQTTKTFKLGDPGMLPHPYFPDRVFWTNKTTWSWYAIATVRESRRDIMSDKHLNECSDADALATALIQRALRNEEEKKRRRVEERDTAKSRKKPRLSVSSAASDHEAVLDSELDEALIISTRAAAKARSHSELVARLESENLGLQAKLDELMNQPAPPAAPQSVPFPPEFLGFMTETFSSQVVLNCNARRAQAETAAAEANKKVVALLSELGMAQQANAHFVQTLRAAEAHWKQECAKSQSATEKANAENAALRSENALLKVANRCFELSLEKQATLGKQSRVASEAALAEAYTKIATLQSDASFCQQAFERTDEALKHANEALKAMEAREEQGSIVQAAATHSGAIETAGLQSSPLPQASDQAGVSRAEDAANPQSKILEHDSAVARLEEPEDSGPKLAEFMHVLKGHFDFVGDLLIEQGAPADVAASMTQCGPASNTYLQRCVEYTVGLESDIARLEQAAQDSRAAQDANETLIAQAQATITDLQSEIASLKVSSEEERNRLTTANAALMKLLALEQEVSESLRLLVRLNEGGGPPKTKLRQLMGVFFALDCSDRAPVNFLGLLQVVQLSVAYMKLYILHEKYKENYLGAHRASIPPLL